MTNENEEARLEWERAVKALPQLQREIEATGLHIWPFRVPAFQDEFVQEKKEVNGSEDPIAGPILIEKSPHPTLLPSDAVSKPLLPSDAFRHHDDGHDGHSSGEN